MMAKGSVVALPLRCFLLFFLPNFTIFIAYFICSEEPQAFLPEYSQPAILHAGHFRWVVNVYSQNKIHLRLFMISFVVSIRDRQGVSVCDQMHMQPYAAFR